MANSQRPKTESVEKRMTQNAEVFGELCDEDAKLSPAQETARDRLIIVLRESFPKLTAQEAMNVLADAQKRVLIASRSLRFEQFSQLTF